MGWVEARCNMHVCLTCDERCQTEFISEYPSHGRLPVVRLCNRMVHDRYHSGSASGDGLYEYTQLYLT